MNYQGSNMNLVQQYKDILNTLYGNTLPRLEDEALRSQLAEIWFKLDDEAQNTVQAYSLDVRKAR
jgi:hypothetical protein